jgi:hypothetical protein
MLRIALCLSFVDIRASCRAPVPLQIDDDDSDDDDDDDDNNNNNNLREG